MKLRLLGVLLALVGLLAPHPACASGPTPSTRDPAKYSSPAKEYLLEVNPSDRYGRGSAHYRLTRRGKEKWSKQLPFTLWNAQLTDEGIAVGYGYSQGPLGYGFGGNFPEGDGTFHEVILTSSGAIRLNRVSERENKLPPYWTPKPYGKGVILDTEHNRVIFRVINGDKNTQGEEWRPYHLSSGAAMPSLLPYDWMPNRDPIGYVLDARPVRNTPLILVHWWGWYKDQTGGRFTLVGPDGKTVWSHDLPGDYTAPNNEELAKQRREWIWENGAILNSEQPGEFEIRFMTADQRVRFRVSPGASGGWTTTEVARQPYLPPPPAPVRTVTAPAIQLERVGTVVLRTSADRVNPIREVRDFAFDGQGRIALLRKETKQKATFLLVTAEGQILREVRLPELSTTDGWQWPHFAWVGGDRFVVLPSRTSGQKTGTGWWVDFRTNSVTAIPDFYPPDVKRVVGFADGGFAFLGSTPDKYGSTETLHGYDARGRELWKRGKRGYSDQPDEMLSPTDLTVTSEGKLAVLDVVCHTIQYFSRQGKYERTIDLDQIWPRKPNYPSGIAGDQNGGLLIADYHGNPPFLRTDANGVIRREFRHRFGDGREFYAFRTQVAPDGRVWTCDGFSLLRLDVDGKADHILGEVPSSANLEKITDLVVGRNGRIYARSQRTSTVHVFDAEGRYLHACRPNPTEIDSGGLWSNLAVSRTGEVHLSQLTSGGYLRFGADGKRIGPSPVKAGGEWYFAPNSDALWATYGDEVERLQPGKPKVAIRRRADGNWLRYVRKAAISPQGRLALMDVAGDGFVEISREVNISLYAPDGKPLRTFQVPTGKWDPYSMVYGDGLVLLSGSGRMVAYSEAGKRLWELPLKEEEYGTPFFTAHNELVVYVGERTLNRYRLPRRPAAPPKQTTRRVRAGVD